MRTNAHGEFAFADVPTEGVELCASGDEIMFAGRMIEPGIDPLAFVLQVDRRMHLQVELAPPTDRAEAVRVLDGHGKAMLLRIMRGETARTNRMVCRPSGTAKHPESVDTATNMSALRTLPRYLIARPPTAAR